MQDFNETPVFIDPVVHPHGGMQDLSDARFFRHWDTNPREVAEKINVVQQGCSETFGRAGILRAYVVEDDLQID